MVYRHSKPWENNNAKPTPQATILKSKKHVHWRRTGVTICLLVHRFDRVIDSLQTVEALHRLADDAHASLGLVEVFLDFRPVHAGVETSINVGPQLLQLIFVNAELLCVVQMQWHVRPAIKIRMISVEQIQRRLLGFKIEQWFIGRAQGVARNSCTLCISKALFLGTGDTSQP